MRGVGEGGGKKKSSLNYTYFRILFLVPDCLHCYHIEFELERERELYKKGTPTTHTHPERELKTAQHT